jgi:hypothetical protein
MKCATLSENYKNKERSVKRGALIFMLEIMMPSLEKGTCVEKEAYF